MRKILSRLHIPLGVGEFRIFAAIVAAMVIIQINCPGDAEAAELKLPSASTSSWSTSVVLSLAPNATAPATVSIGRPGCSTSAQTLDPGGVAVVRDPNLWLSLCGVGSFAMLDAPANAFAVLSFDDGVNRSSFTATPTNAATADYPTTFFPLISDDRSYVWVTVFPSERTDVKLTFKSDGLSTVESFLARPPVAQYRLQARGAGALSIELPALICNLCPTPKPLYGFVTNGDARGGNLRYLPF